MCDALYEFFEKEIKEEVEKRTAEKVEEKLAEKTEKAARDKMIELINKKLAKGKSIEQIADELEESVETIQELMESMNN